MRYGAHPISGRPITPEDYEKEFGKPVDENRKTRDRPSALCPACKQSLHLKGELDPEVTTIFSHNPNSGACPIKESGKHKYSVLPDVDEDTDRSRKLKASFLENWKFHWNRFRKYAGHADIEDFIALIEYADKRNVWRYRNLEECEVVIVLLVIKDFKPVINSKGHALRKYWVRFWFESTVKGFDDFWNLPDASKRVLKASYKVPDGEKLSPDYLVEYEVVAVDRTYLTNPAPDTDTVHTYLERKMSSILKKLQKNMLKNSSKR